MMFVDDVAGCSIGGCTEAKVFGKRSRLGKLNGFGSKPFGTSSI